MSGHFIVLIPADRQARPDHTVLQNVKEALVLMAGTDEARVKDFGDRMQFIDCGENLERILCPACGAEAETGWWGHQMDHCWDDETGFDLHAHAMPCCGAPLALDRLTYEPHQGFSRWFVSVRNPGRGPLTPEEHSALERVAGASLAVIYQTY